jgi:hypothetical protein
VSAHPQHTSTKRTRKVFTEVEDERIRQLVLQHGEGKWHLLADELPGRTARQCRERWLSYLSPHVVNGAWTADEDRLLLTKAEELGHQWKTLERLFPGRSNINIKNHWRQLTKKAATIEAQSKKKSDGLLVFDRIFSKLASETDSGFNGDPSQPNLP